MKKNLTLLTCIVSVCLLLASCSTSIFDDSSKKYVIDNPLDQEITIKLDGTEHKIAAKSSIDAEITYGAHELTYNDQTVKFIAKPCEKPVVLNPTLSNYVAYAEVYYYENTKVAESRGKLLLKSFSRDYKFPNGKVKKVPFRVFNSFIIEGEEGQWNFGVNAPFPKEVTKTVNENLRLTAEMKVKLFREQEFIDFMDNGIQLRKPEITKLSDLVAQDIIDEKFLKFDCEQAQPIGDSLKIYFDKLNTTSGTEFVEAYEVFANITDIKKNVVTRLFTPELRATCKNSNFSTNEEGVTEAIRNMQNINAWIIK